MASKEELLVQIDELKAEIVQLKARIETSVIRSPAGTLHFQPGLAYMELPHGGLLEVWRNTTTAENDPPGLISVY